MAVIMFLGPCSSLHAICPVSIPSIRNVNAQLRLGSYTNASRGSSTPVAHHTIFFESLTKDFIISTTAHHHRKPYNLDHLSNTTKISFTHSHRLLHLVSFSCGYSEYNIRKPSNSRLPTPRCNFVKRSQSDIILEGLALSSQDTNQDFRSRIGSYSVGKSRSMLHTEPSFCIYADEDGFLENEKGDLRIKSSEGMEGCEFTFAKSSMGLIMEDDEQIEPPPSPKMYLATGFGIDGMGGIELKPTTFDESGDVEEYYKMMVGEDPCNPLFLRNYAQLLQSKGDLTGAEDYYLRAAVEDPKDGEILMQYAKLIWELHRDQDRALCYFERAAHAAPGDCNILAAYASFLWDIDKVQAEDYDHIHGGLIQKTLEVEERRGSP